MTDLAVSLRSVPDKAIFDRLLRFAFQEFQNIYWAPSWWQALPQAVRETITSWMRTQGGVPPKTVRVL